MYGFRVSKPGYDVKIATGSELAFDADKHALKIFSTGQLTLTTDASGNATVSVLHGMSYAPGFEVFRKDTAKWPLLENVNNWGSYLPVGGVNYWASDNIHQAIHAYCDDSKLYIQVDGGEINKAMIFRYYTYVDRSQDFTGADGISTAETHGIESAKDGFDIKTCKEYEKAFSSKYKILQFNPQNEYTETLTLPATFATHHDDFVEQGTYVDFNHNLGYPPLFKVFFTNSDGTFSAPFSINNGLGSPFYSVTGFCNSSKVRISFYRNSTFFNNTLYGDLAAETITLKVIAYTVNLNG